MAKLWYKNLGFYENPFNIKPSVYSYDLVGCEEMIKDIVYIIESANVLFLEGMFGYGKTSLLKCVMNELKKRKVIYYSCNQDRVVDIEEVLMKKQGFLSRLFEIKPKNIILFLDEVQFLKKQTADKIKYYYDQKNIKSVIFAGNSYEDVNFTDSLRHRIGNRIIRTGPLPIEKAVELIRKRIGDLPLLSNEIIKRINVISKGNPRVLLRNCEDVCKFAVDNGQDRVSQIHLKILK